MRNLLLGNKANSAPSQLFFCKVTRFYATSNTVDVVTIDDDVALSGCQIACSMPVGFSFGQKYIPSHDDYANEEGHVMSPSDVYCIAAYLNGDFYNSVVIGFLFPKETTLSIPDYGLYLFRHESGVMWMVRGDGTIQVYHPSGSIIKIGKDDTNEMTEEIMKPAKADGLYVPIPDNYNKERVSDLNIKWYKGQKVTLNSSGEIIIQTEAENGSSKITMTPLGEVSIDSSKSINITSDDVNINTSNNANINVGENAFVHVDTGQVFLSTSDLVISAPPDSIKLSVPGMGSYLTKTGEGHEHSGSAQFYVVNGMIIQGTYP